MFKPGWTLTQGKDGGRELQIPEPLQFCLVCPKD